MRARRLIAALLLAAPLSGCLPMMAANVVDAGVGAAMSQPKPNAGEGPTATATCSARAQPYGVVHVIDTEQHDPSTIIVWGTATAGTARKSFKCVYGTRIKSFRLRDLPPVAS